MNSYQMPPGRAEAQTLEEGSESEPLKALAAYLAALTSQACALKKGNKERN